eukprot:c25191_g8_i3 orf=16-165(-)
MLLEWLAFCRSDTWIPPTIFRDHASQLAKSQEQVPTIICTLGITTTSCT